MRAMIVAGVLALGLLAGSQAEAMPVQSGLATAGQSDVILVRAGCGFGAHRGGYGGCRLNRGPRGAIRALVAPRRRVCPPGRHLGPAGRACRRNRY